MYKTRNLVYFVAIGVLLVSACTPQTPVTTLPGTQLPPNNVVPSRLPATATPEPTREIDPALRAAMEKCGKVLPGLACLVEGPVQMTAQPKRTLTPFTKPGQVISLADLQSLKLGEAGSTKGIVVMRIQTEWPGGAFTAVAFGNMELFNEVPYGTREFNPMQSLKLATGPNEKGQLPTSGFMVSSPEDENLSTLVVNGAELRIGSTGLLTSLEGGLTIQTVQGVIGFWQRVQEMGKFALVEAGKRLDLTKQEIERGKERLSNLPEDEFYKRFGEYEWWILVTENRCLSEDCKKFYKKWLAEEELKKKQKAWKGGWWKMTYGTNSSIGQCKVPVTADGYTGEKGEPYSTEIPICRGNNGKTILMYNSGTSYDRVAPNLYAKSFVTEFDQTGKGNYTREGKFMTLHVVSPTRMILKNVDAEADGCTSSNVIYLDFVRDDPNVRCGQIIYINPYTTPRPPTATPEPKKVEPPVKGPYKVRLGMPLACDAAAKPFAPNFTTANLSLSPENKLVIDTTSKKYELELANLTYPYDPGKEKPMQVRYGIFTMGQPLDNTFNFTMSVLQMPDQQWTGGWLVTNGDGSKQCGGSIDMLPPK